MDNLEIKRNKKDEYEDNKSFPFLLDELQTKYPQFIGLTKNSKNSDWVKCLRKHQEYNDKNSNYLKLKEINCNVNKTFDPLKKDIYEPIVLRGFYKDTNAFKKWNLNTLPSIFGNNKTTIECYYNYIHFMNASVNYTKKYNMKEFIDSFKKELIYMGEQSIYNFDSKQLNKDIYNQRLTTEPMDSVIFMGYNANSHTHIHSGGNRTYILNQVIGTKTMFFFDLNDNIEHGFGISSPFIDSTFIHDYNNKNSVRDMGLHIQHLDHKNLTLYKVTLYPGDSIAIPPWWWHNATCDGISLSITDKIDRNHYNQIYKYPILLYHDLVSNYLRPALVEKYIPKSYKHNIKFICICLYLINILLIYIPFYLICKYYNTDIYLNKYFIFFIFIIANLAIHYRGWRII